MAQEDTTEHFADQQIHCEIDKIREAEGECLKPGEVELDGSVLCVRHAKLLRLQDRSELMLGVVFEMDQWLESVDAQADELSVRRVEHQREEVVEQLRYDRIRIGLIHDELLRNPDGKT